MQLSPRYARGSAGASVLERQSWSEASTEISATQIMSNSRRPNIGEQKVADSVDMASRWARSRIIGAGHMAASEYAVGVAGGNMVGSSMRYLAELAKGWNAWMHNLHGNGKGKSGHSTIIRELCNAVACHARRLVELERSRSGLETRASSSDGTPTMVDLGNPVPQASCFPATPGRRRRRPKKKPVNGDLQTTHPDSPPAMSVPEYHDLTALDCEANEDTITRADSEESNGIVFVFGELKQESERQWHGTSFFDYDELPDLPDLPPFPIPATEPADDRVEPVPAQQEDRTACTVCDGTGRSTFGRCKWCRGLGFEQQPPACVDCAKSLFGRCLACAAAPLKEKAIDATGVPEVKSLPDFARLRREAEEAERQLYELNEPERASVTATVGLREYYEWIQREGGRQWVARKTAAAKKEHIQLQIDFRAVCAETAEMKGDFDEANHHHDQIFVQTEHLDRLEGISARAGTADDQCKHQ